MVLAKKPVRVMAGTLDAFFALQTVILVLEWDKEYIWRGSREKGLKAMSLSSLFREVVLASLSSSSRAASNTRQKYCMFVVVFRIFAFIVGA